MYAQQVVQNECKLIECYKCSHAWRCDMSVTSTRGGVTTSKQLRGVTTSKQLRGIVHAHTRSASPFDLIRVMSTVQQVNLRQCILAIVTIHYACYNTYNILCPLSLAQGWIGCWRMPAASAASPGGAHLHQWWLHVCQSRKREGRKMCNYMNL